MIIINPREVCTEILEDIAVNGSYSNIALKKALKQNGAMPPRDRAFVTENVNGTLRNIIYIDYVINAFSNTKTEKMKAWVLAVFRSCVYQIMFMDVPESAAINESVKLIKKRGLFGLSGFANAVLRKIAKGYKSVDFPENKAEYISIRYSHPLWLVKMWISYYGEDFTEKLCIANGEKPSVTICMNTLKTDMEGLKESLEKDGVLFEDGVILKNSLRISKVSDMSSLSAFKKGYFHVQDESSSLAVNILSPKKGENNLDVCASPGGKTVLMAEIMENEGSITARDIFDHRLQLIDDTAKRLGIDIIKTENFDAAELNEKDIEKYDRVLLDAPCSGFGLMRKKADIRLTKNGNDIDSLIKIQRQMLSTVWQYVKKGGILVYSTCTVSKKENQKNIEWFIENFPFETVDISEYVKNISSPDSKNGYIQLFTNVHKTDGFFIAKLRRKE